jgi:hypothetical protein
MSGVRVAVVVLACCLAAAVAGPAVAAVDGTGATEPGAIGASAGVSVGAASPEAACRLDDRRVPPGESVTIDATNTTGSVEELLVDVDGDGAFDRRLDEDRRTRVRYSRAGEYRPAVRAVGPDGNDTAACGTLSVSAFDYDPERPVVGETVTFDASNWEDPDGFIAAYRWDVDGDGRPEVVRSNPEAEPPATAEYVFERPGEVAVTLTVEDNDGAAVDSTERLTVRAAGAPTARCSVAPTAATVGESVTVNASASDGAATVGVDREGDGVLDLRGRDAAPTVVYDRPGEYRPVVVVENDAGEDRTRCPAVTVVRAVGPTTTDPAASGTATPGTTPSTTATTPARTTTPPATATTPPTTSTTTTARAPTPTDPGPSTATDDGATDATGADGDGTDTAGSAGGASGGFPGFLLAVVGLAVALLAGVAVAALVLVGR